MDEENRWQENHESGVTPGPEEALHREIEKSKALKVERLKLRNEIETLRSQNHRLREENRQLKENLSGSGKIGADGSTSEQMASSSFPLTLRHSLVILIFVISLIFYYTFSR